MAVYIQSRTFALFIQTSFLDNYRDELIQQPLFEHPHLLGLINSHSGNVAGFGLPRRPQ